MKSSKSSGLTALIVLGTLLGGCASTPPNTQLVDARDALNKAQQNPEVYQNAPIALKEAEEAVVEAERLQNAHSDKALVTHKAYIAYRRVQIAEEKAKINAAAKEVENAEAERREVLLQSRVKEANVARAQAESERQKAQGLSKQLTELQAKQTPRGTVLTLGDVLFDVGRAQLKPGAYSTLDRLAKYLNENPERNVMIEGFTDSTGSEEFNQQLSEQRARAVQLGLVDRGVATSRVRITGYGMRYPVASNATASGRQRNRRIEIVISDQTGNIPQR